MGLLRNSGEKDDGAVAQALPSLTPPHRYWLKHLEHRDEKSALGVVSSVASSADPAVKVAAIHALGVLGDAGTVPTLLTAATSGEDEVKRTANESLDVLRGKDVDEMMLNALAGSDTDRRAVLIRSLATRGAKSALPALYTATGDSDEGIRAKAFDALGTLAGPDELTKLIGLLAKINGNSAQPQAESAIVAVSQKVPDSNARAKAVLDALSASKDKKVRASYTKVAGRIGDSNALPTLRELAAQSRSRTGRRSAALCNGQPPRRSTTCARWPPNRRTTRSALAFNIDRIVRMDNGSDLETQLKVYAEALALAKSPDDKRPCRRFWPRR